MINHTSELLLSYCEIDLCICDKSVLLNIGIPYIWHGPMEHESHNQWSRGFHNTYNVHSIMSCHPNIQICLSLYTFYVKLRLQRNCIFSLSKLTVFACFTTLSLNSILKLNYKLIRTFSSNPLERCISSCLLYTIKSSLQEWKFTFKKRWHLTIQYPKRSESVPKINSNIVHYTLLIWFERLCIARRSHWWHK